MNTSGLYTPPEYNVITINDIENNDDVKIQTKMQIKNKILICFFVILILILISLTLILIYL